MCLDLRFVCACSVWGTESHRQTDSRNKWWVSFRDLFRVWTTPRFPWVQTHRWTSVFTCHLCTWCFRFLCLHCSTVSEDAQSHVCMSDEQRGRDALSSSVSTLTDLKRPLPRVSLHGICVCFYFTCIITDAEKPLSLSVPWIFNPGVTALLLFTWNFPHRHILKCALISRMFAPFSASLCEDSALRGDFLHLKKLLNELFVLRCLTVITVIVSNNKRIHYSQ